MNHVYRTSLLYKILERQTDGAYISQRHPCSHHLTPDRWCSRPGRSSPPSTSALSKGSADSSTAALQTKRFLTIRTLVQIPNRLHQTSLCVPQPTPPVSRVLIATLCFSSDHQRRSNAVEPKDCDVRDDVELLRVYCRHHLTRNTSWFSTSLREPSAIAPVRHRGRKKMRNSDVMDLIRSLTILSINQWMMG